MQTLSATLAAAQQLFDVRPVVKVLVSDHPPEAPRLSELTSRYAGGEPDAPFDAAWIGGSSGSGQIVRAYLSGGTLKAQVVMPPGDQTTWSTWTTLDSAAGNWAGTCQVAVAGTQDGSGKAYCFWVASDGHTIKWSTWNGSAWGAALTVIDVGAGNLVGGLASDGMDPTIRLYYVISGGQLCEIHLNALPNSWSGPVGDGASWGGPTIGAGFRPTTAPNGDGDGFVLIASGSPTTLQLRQFRITSGSGWVGSTNTLLSAGVNTGYSYAYPKLAETRSDSKRQALCWSETAPAPLGTLPMIAFTPTHTSIQGVVPWRYGGTHGVKVFRDTFAAPSWWVITSNQVYSCPADTGSFTTGQRVSFSSDQVVGFRLDLPRPNGAATGEITVLNENGVLGQGGLAGPYRALRPWSQVALSLGYHTSLPGDETIWQIPLWIEGIVWHDETDPGQPLVTLRLVDAWGILDRLVFRSTVTYTSVSVEQLLRLCLWHVCGQLSGTGSARTALTLGSFTVRAGESVGEVARRLCDLAGIALVFRTNPSSVDGTGFDSVGVVGVSWGAGGAVYSYGPSAGQHPIIASEVEPSIAPSATAVEVAGATTWSVVRNWAPTWLLWREIQSRVVDKTLPTQALTDSVAANLAASLVPELAGGSITVLANVGQEIGDQVNLNVPTSPVSAIGAPYTVAGMVLSYSAEVGVILQTLLLQGSA